MQAVATIEEFIAKSEELGKSARSGAISAITVSSGVFDRIAWEMGLLMPDPSSPKMPIAEMTICGVKIVKGGH